MNTKQKLKISCWLDFRTETASLNAHQLVTCWRSGSWWAGVTIHGVIITPDALLGLCWHALCADGCRESTLCSQKLSWMQFALILLCSKNKNVCIFAPGKLYRCSAPPLSSFHMQPKGVQEKSLFFGWCCALSHHYADHWRTAVIQIMT